MYGPTDPGSVPSPTTGQRPAPTAERVSESFFGPEDHPVTAGVAPTGRLPEHGDDLTVGTLRNEQSRAVRSPTCRGRGHVPPLTAQVPRTGGRTSGSVTQRTTGLSTPRWSAGSWAPTLRGAGGPGRTHTRHRTNRLPGPGNRVPPTPAPPATLTSCAREPRSKERR